MVLVEFKCGKHTITQTLCPIRVCVSVKHCFVGPRKALEEVFFLYLSLNSEIVKNKNIVLLILLNQLVKTVTI